MTVKILDRDRNLISVSIFGQLDLLTGYYRMNESIRIDFDYEILDLRYILPV